ncbi:hypothetical protein JYU34_018385 [Plutella xylostella]|uniref:PX domain-containing protein n=1 Tax=Plutella xylostella TaxID=51655 RepID=A0ABQ7PXP3_PLUXY|nr:hypothetical protein JYU34_018385 [Plutella xylostella]
MQRTRQESWQAERRQLLHTQKKLHEALKKLHKVMIVKMVEEIRQERSAMEREYSLACRRLSGDWSTLERGWSARRRALRVRARQLRDRQRRHQATSERHARAAETEGEHAAALRRLIEGKAADLDGYVRSTVKELVAQGYTVDESLTPSPESPISDVSSESLMRILEQCDPDTATSIKDTVERHKQEISELESELDIRTASVASHRAKVERLQAELALLAAQEEGLRRALASDDAASPEPSPLDGVKRSKSELVLRPSRDDDDVLDPLSADEREEFRSRKNSLTLPLDPLGSPESYHTASPTSATPTADTTTPTADAAPSLVSSWPTTDAASSLVSSSRQTADSEHSLVSSSRQTADSEQSLASSRPEFLIDGRCDEDGSSNDECSTSRVADGQSSSSLDRSPDERHQRAKYRRRLGDGKPRRQVTEAEALRAMQRLCQRIAAQKMLVISSLENDCSKEDLNRQIAVLQELQKKYVRLEMALQYSFFEPRAQEPPPRAPRPAPLPLAPIVSEVQVPDSTLQVTDVNENSFEDPLMSRLKECELEASDNVSTSNDELHSDRDWSDREERRLRRAHTDTLPPTITDGLTHPIDFDQVIVIPGWVTRGAGASTHHEYEVRVTLGRERYTLLRRYRRFRQLQLHANKIYGQKLQLHANKIYGQKYEALHAAAALPALPAAAATRQQDLWTEGEWVVASMRVRGATRCCGATGASGSCNYTPTRSMDRSTRRYTLLRRYRRFRQLQLHAYKIYGQKLHLAASKIYGQKVASIPFPPRTLWPGAGVARARRPALEAFVRRLLAVCATDPQCPFHRAPLNGDTLRAFSPPLKMASCRVITIAACLLAALASVECVEHVMYHDPLHHQLMGYPIPAGAPVLVEYRGGYEVPRGWVALGRHWEPRVVRKYLDPDPDVVINNNIGPLKMASCRVITIAACLLAALASVECVDHVIYHDPLYHQQMGYPIPTEEPVWEPRFGRYNLKTWHGVAPGGDERARHWTETAIFSVERDSQGHVVSLQQKKLIRKPRQNPIKG